MASKRETIYEKVDNAVNLNDLTVHEILEQIPFNTMQNFLKNELNTFDDHKINKIFYDTCPMTEILPNEIIQQILSYDQYSVDNKLVNKAFKKLSENNEKNEIKQRNKIIKQLQESNVDIRRKYFSDSAEYWIVDENRTELNEKEIGLGYKGPVNNIMDVINKFESGDTGTYTLLIYDGIYEINDISDVIINNKISFIGMGSNVIIKQLAQIIVENYVYFKNIDIYFDSIYYEELSDGDEELEELEDPDIWSICVTTNGHIWMEHCKMTVCKRYGCIVMYWNAKNTSIYLTHCDFHSNNPGPRTISISAFGNSATILGCKFTSFGDCVEPCTTIRLQPIRDKQIPKIRIIGNEVVGDHVGKWITSVDDKKLIDGFNKFGPYEIKNNLIKGKNSIFKNLNNKLERRNPNKIYQIFHLRKCSID